MKSQALNNFVNLSKNGIIYRYLQPSKIKQDFKDIQSVTDLLKFSLIKPAEESNLISLSSDKVPTEAIRRDLKNVYDMRKAVMDIFIDRRLVSQTKPIYDPIKKLRLGPFNNMNRKVKVKVKKQVLFIFQSEIFGKITLIVYLQDIFKQWLRSVLYGFADSMGTIIKTKNRSVCRPENF